MELAYFCPGMTQENDYSVIRRLKVIFIHSTKFTISTALHCCICFSLFLLSSSPFQKRLLIRRQKDSASVEPTGEESANRHGQLIKHRQLHKKRKLRYRERKLKDRNNVKGKGRSTDTQTKDGHLY